MVAINYSNCNPMPSSKAKLIRTRHFLKRNENYQEKIREQRGTIRALAGICQFHLSYF